MNEHWHSSKTQVYWTCLALGQGRTIDHMNEIGEVKGWRLAAIIYNLRRNYHWPIETEYKGPERIAHYQLATGTDWRVLDFPRSAKDARSALKEARDDNGGCGNG
jgi:hypothetical protein